MTDKRNLSLFKWLPLVRESIVGIKLSAELKDVRDLRRKIEQEVLKFPGPENRKRLASEMIRRFIKYNKDSYEIKKSFLTTFMLLESIPYRGKVQVLYYEFTKTHPIIFEVFKILAKEYNGSFSTKDLELVVSSLTGKLVKKENWSLRLLAYSLDDFHLVEKISPGKYRILQQQLEPSAFLFILYDHFLFKGSVVPKVMDIKIFFKELYNQPEEETEKLLRDLSQGGWWTIERMAHLDQVALTYNSMDRFMEAFLKKYQRTKNDSDILSEGSKS
jgi:hypothetical protein